jgi:hypothetical protein
MFFLLFSTSHQVGFPQAGGLKDISRWLTERGSAQMASPQAMARRAGHDRVLALAGGHGHNEAWRATSLVPQAGGLKDISRWLSEAWRATPPVMNKKRMHPGGMLP